MNSLKTGKLLVAGLAGALLAGCQAPPSDSSQARMDADGIPQVTALYKEITHQPVHRYRKPVRDRRARMLRLLQTECDRLLADVQTWDSSAELTAASPADQNVMRSQIASLQSSLETMRSAVASSNISAIRSSHSQAVAAYTGIQAKMNSAGA